MQSLNFLPRGVSLLGQVSLCRLQSNRDHFVLCLSGRLSGSHTFLVVTLVCFAGDTCIPWNAAIKLYFMLKGQ